MPAALKKRPSSAMAPDVEAPGAVDIAIKAKVPPSLKRWLDGEEVWTSTQSQGVKDWQRALSEHGHSATSKHHIDLYAVCDS